jgi:hypothetical protein
MHSARTLLATAAASAVLVLGAPAAYAEEGDHGDSSYGKEEHGKEHGKEEQGKEHGKEEHGKETWEDSSHEGEYKETGGEKDHSEQGKHDEDSWRGEHEKPRGGMHTGGGALAGDHGRAGRPGGRRHGPVRGAP